MNIEFAVAYSNKRRRFWLRYIEGSAYPFTPIGPWKDVPEDLQRILDRKFHFHTRSNTDQIFKFARMWMNPKTCKLAELLYL